MILADLFEQILDEGSRDPLIFKCVFVVGAPGSGKSSVIKQLGLEAMGLKQGDVDQTLARLKQLRKTQEVDYDHSLPVTLRRQSLWMQNYLGMVINTTGRDVDKVLELKHIMTQAGYDTFMIYVEVDKETAIRRIGARPSISTDLADRNRQVDVGYFHQAYAAVIENLEHYQIMFGNDLAVVTNNNELVESRQLFLQTLNQAAKKLRRFFARPLNDVAVNRIKSSTL